MLLLVVYQSRLKVRWKNRELQVLSHLQAKIASLEWHLKISVNPMILQPSSVDREQVIIMAAQAGRETNQSFHTRIVMDSEGILQEQHLTSVKCLTKETKQLHFITTPRKRARLTSSGTVKHAKRIRSYSRRCSIDTQETQPVRDSRV